MPVLSETVRWLLNSVSVSGAIVSLHNAPPAFKDRPTVLCGLFSSRVATHLNAHFVIGICPSAPTGGSAPLPRAYEQPDKQDDHNQYPDLVDGIHRGMLGVVLAVGLRLVMSVRKTNAPSQQEYGD